MNNSRLLLLSPKHYKSIEISLFKILTNQFFFQNFNSIKEFSSISTEKDIPKIESKIKEFIEDLIYFNILSCKNGNVSETDKKFKYFLEDLKEEDVTFVVKDIHLLKLLYSVKDNIDSVMLENYLQSSNMKEYEMNSYNFVKEFISYLQNKIVLSSKEYAKNSEYIW